MERAMIVKVAVSAAPYAIDKPYDYYVPEALRGSAAAGMRVSLPFGRGNRRCEGIILALGSADQIQHLKPIDKLLDDSPVLTRQEIDMALWIRQRYFCTFYEAAKLLLPVGLWYRLRESWRLTQDAEQARERCREIRGGERILEALQSSGESAFYEDLRAKCGDETLSALRQMEALGIVACTQDVQRKVQDKKRQFITLSVSPEAAMAVVTPRQKQSPTRYEAVRFLCAVGKSACADVCYYTGATMRVLKGLEKLGLAAFSNEEELRLPQPQEVEPGLPIVLNEEQQRAYDQICGWMGSGAASAVLLYGVTGSGKTQVYLRLVQEALRQEKTAIVLVPEIVLTPQMMRKFSAYFGDSVAMLHSSLRVSERYDQWKRIRRGEVRVVLGTRSAIFAPLRNLGLIILDEEQESSYQSESSPRYHTRDIAKYLCAREKAVLVLGSATPAVESAWNAREGIYHQVILRKRYNAHHLPKVILADLRQEIRKGNPGSIGEELKQELQWNLDHGEQSILFLNRRGDSRMLLCGECGFVPKCVRCSAPMTFHSANHRLMCHYCGFSLWAMERCPECGGLMKHIGTGTQKVEAELNALFPDTEVLRMDADTASGGHEKLLSRFEKERIPILLGTQMVAKGLDFENVTLVGVLSADLSLYVDHYRAAERTFSLITQVVGRAGRGEKLGRAVIQTFTPGNDVIVSAAAQDYDRFYESEIHLRELRRCPPFADLFTLTVSGMEEELVLRSAIQAREMLRRIAAEPAVARTNPLILGPAPAPVLKLNNHYRYRLLLVGKNDKPTREYLSWLLKEFSSDNANRKTHLTIDCNGLD